MSLFLTQGGNHPSHSKLGDLARLERPLLTEHPEPDYDELLMRIWRTYILVEELGEEPQTPRREVALRALDEAQGGTFLPLRDHLAYRN